MTQEEKAKAYDEALEKAKIEINTKGIGETVNLCEQLFPELRENEDESLKNKSGYYKAGKFWKASTLWNATKNKIPQRVSNRYILQECTWNIGNLQDFANEVKNVQEVSLDYPIILDMNGNIIDGAHRVVKAYLEGKDIDIVYIGDDEWPEPDYDEEKAVKESDDERIRKRLIEYFEGFRMGNAEVRWEGLIVQEVLAWLEKQKEQKPSALQDAFEHSVKDYSLEEKSKASNYADRILPTSVIYGESEEEYKLHKIMEAAFIAGQKEQNGEDGFLEDELSAFLQNYDKEYDDDAAVSDVARHFYEIGKKQNEQKPHTDDEKEYVRTIKSIISDFIRDKKPENLAYYQRIYDWLDGRHVPFSCGHENGKPADYNEYKMLIDGAREDGKIEGRKEVIDHPDKYGLTKQKPVESIEGGVLTHLGNED